MTTWWTFMLSQHQRLHELQNAMKSSSFVHGAQPCQELWKVSVQTWRNMNRVGIKQNNCNSGHNIAHWCAAMCTNVTWVHVWSDAFFEWEKALVAQCLSGHWKSGILAILKWMLLEASDTNTWKFPAHQATRASRPDAQNIANLAATYWNWGNECEQPLLDICNILQTK